MQPRMRSICLAAVSCGFLATTAAHSEIRPNGLPGGHGFVLAQGGPSAKETEEEKARRQKREQGRPQPGQSGRGLERAPPQGGQPPKGGSLQQKQIPPAGRPEQKHVQPPVGQVPPKARPEGLVPKHVQTPSRPGQDERKQWKGPEPRKVQTPQQQPGSLSKQGEPPQDPRVLKGAPPKPGQFAQPPAQGGGGTQPKSTQPTLLAPNQKLQPAPGGQAPRDLSTGRSPQQGGDRPAFGRLEDLKKQRHERVEDGGKRTVIEEPDKRVIVKQDGRTFIRHDESERFRLVTRNARTERHSDGTSVTIISRPTGQVFSVVDANGRLVRRYRRTRDGREVVMIDNRRHFGPGKTALAIGLGAGLILALAPPVIHIPRDKYIVDYAHASREDVYEALSAPPLEPLERDYTLEEIRANQYLRDRMRRVDLDVINFEFGSWEVTPDQYPRLEWVAQAMMSLIDRNPEEVFMLEGYTDAVGSDVDNLTLSDRRAEQVAIILSEQFGVPAENLVTQGYGEQFLKVETEGPERANRRVAVRRITPLMSRSRM